MKQIFFLLVTLILSFSGCSLVATTVYKPWHGPEKVFTGQGGSMVEIEGKELWEHGAPAEGYMVIGFIEQSASDSILFTDYSRQEIIKRVIENDGDGVILIEENETITGYQSTPDYVTGGYDLHPTTSINKVLAVFKYQ